MNFRANETTETLRKCFRRYQTSNLKSITIEEFSRSVQCSVEVIDAESEGYIANELPQQRDLSIKFHWGHNHDFGTFQMVGRMADRHIGVLANFISLFAIRLEDFENRRIFDVGCWTGGTTLLLAALAEEVFAIEEVKKYAEMVGFLATSFGIEDRVTIRPVSIYECNSSAFHSRFDIVYFPGVIYHLTDPVLALRILFNSLTLDGCILVESAGINHPEAFCRFDGSLIHYCGTVERLNRTGWNWFMPSPTALYRMMREAGFDEIQTLWHNETGRVYGYGKKISQVGICKAGLSVSAIL